VSFDGLSSNERDSLDGYQSGQAVAPTPAELLVTAIGTAANIWATGISVMLVLAALLFFLGDGGDAETFRDLLATPAVGGFVAAVVRSIIVLLLARRARTVATLAGIAVGCVLLIAVMYGLVA